MLNRIDQSKLFERSVIGAILLNKTYIDDVIEILTPDDFNDPFFKDAFRIINRMYENGHGNNIDALTVACELVDEDAELRFFEAMNETPDHSNVLYYANKVKDESKSRNVIKIANELLKNVHARKDDALGSALDAFSRIYEDQKMPIESYEKALPEVLTQMINDAALGKELAGISTGFKGIDEYLCGLQGGQLIILGARPGVGKTMLSLNIANNVGIDGKLPVAFISLEMPKNQVLKRTISQRAKVPSEIVFANKLSDNDIIKIDETIDKILSSPVYVSDKSSMTTRDIRVFCRTIKKEKGLSLIVVDYLGLIDGEGENETIKVGRISRELKSIARDLDVPLLCLCQLRRRNEDDFKPQLSDLRQSGEIEQHADVVMFLHNEKSETSLHDVKLTFAKVRNGKVGEMGLRANKNYMEFTE